MQSFELLLFFLLPFFYFFFFLFLFFFLHQSKSSFLEQKGSASTCILYLLEIVKPPSKMKNTREELNDE